MGRPWRTLDAAAYQQAKPALLDLVLGPLADLRARFDVVICEGAGSPAEINLLDRDIVNLRVARRAGLPAIVVGDIDRGGVFAALFGTVALLPDDLRATVRGSSSTSSGATRACSLRVPSELRRRTGLPTLGVLPWLDGLNLDAEDSLALGAGWPGLAASPPAGPARGARRGRHPLPADLQLHRPRPAGRRARGLRAPGGLRGGPRSARSARPAGHQVHRRRPGLAPRPRSGRRHRGNSRPTGRPARPCSASAAATRCSAPAWRTASSPIRPESSPGSACCRSRRCSSPPR